MTRLDDRFAELKAAGPDQVDDALMNLCGRDDKDVFTVAKHLGMDT